jgi:ATP-dependent Clp protease ATP-binding subunit ClpC
VADKRAYLGLVIRTCIVDYEKQVMPRIRERFGPEYFADVEVSLYQTCVDVNPNLEIHQVSIPLHEAGTADETPLPDEQLTRAPAPRTSPDRLRLLGLHRALTKRIIGQDAAIEKMVQAVQKAAIGLRDEKRPVGCFLLVGSTGVGKTELAKALAAELYGEPERAQRSGSLIRVDCSELAMPHEYSKLIGSPPGYVGHADGGFLTEALKERPDSVVLFDEIEKADSKVHHLLLQAMDEGILTDGQGERVSLRRAVLILTSNIGTAEVAQMENRAGFTTRPDELVDHAARVRATRLALERRFTPEFLNRLDEVIVFRDLDENDSVKIVDLFLGRLSRRLKRLGIAARVTRGARQQIARSAFSRKYGARELGRAVQRLVESPIAGKILTRRIAKGARLRVGARRGEILIEAA